MAPFLTQPTVQLWQLWAAVGRGEGKFYSGVIIPALNSEHGNKALILGSRDFPKARQRVENREEKTRTLCLGVVLAIADIPADRVPGEAIVRPSRGEAA